jgi:hypothetical protein
MPRASSPAPRRRRPRRAVLAALTGTLLLVVAACSGSGADSAGESDAGAPMTAPESQADGARSAAGDAVLRQAEPATGAGATAADRQVITTGHATVVAAAPVAGARAHAPRGEGGGGPGGRRRGAGRGGV